MGQLTDAFYRWQLATPEFNQLLKIICPKCLTIKEAEEIIRQFNESWIDEKQVLWTGVVHTTVEEWANQRGMQTLTSAMGDLMNRTHPKYKKLHKTSVQWTKYMKGVSAIFAWKIAQGHTVTLLTPPPPVRFHPSGLTNYQDIEEPILKGAVDGSFVGKIVVIHPEVEGAEDMAYEYWPKDEVAKWYAKCGSKSHGTKMWRAISPKRRAMIWPAKVDIVSDPVETAILEEMEVFMIIGLLLSAEVCMHLGASLEMSMYHLSSTLFPRNRVYSSGHDEPQCLVITHKSEAYLNVDVGEEADPALLLLSVPRSSLKTVESVMKDFMRPRSTKVHRDPGLTLAGLHSTAVDFSKTGIPVDPREIPKAPRFRSDFLTPAPPARIFNRSEIEFLAPENPMDEDGEEVLPAHQCYKSEKILGVLYRIVDERQIWNELWPSEIPGCAVSWAKGCVPV